jgi:hypothetical protein
VDSVPQSSEAIAYYGAEGCRHRDENGASSDLEGFDDIDRPDEMHPEDEVDDGLRPAERYERRPAAVPPAYQHANTRAARFGLIGCITLLLRDNVIPLARRRCLDLCQSSATRFRPCSPLLASAKRGQAEPCEAAGCKHGRKLGAAAKGKSRNRKTARQPPHNGGKMARRSAFESQ